MRKHWLGVVTLVGATVGCAGPGGSGGFGGAQTAQNPMPHSAQYANAPAAYGQAPIGQRPFGQTGPYGQSAFAPTAYTAAAPPPAAQSPAQPGFTQKLTTALTTNPFAATSDKSAVTPELYVSMAEMADRGGNADQARKLYRQAMGVEASNLPALLGLARLEDREGNLDEALTVYQQAATAHPQDPQALNDLALCYARKSDLPKSAQLLEQAIQIAPQKALYRNNLAKVLVELNAIDHAVAHLAAVHGPAAAQYNIGVLLMQRGRNDEAIRHLSIATQIDPQLEAAQTLLAQLAPTAAPQFAQQPATNAPMQPQTPPAPNGYQAYLAAQAPAGWARQPAPQQPALQPAPQPGQAWGYPVTTNPASQAVQAPIEVPGSVSPTRVGQAPTGLPPAR